MRKLFAAFLLNVSCCFWASAQQVITHVIDRGETLASIAAKYGVTTQQIIDLNPAAASFVYTGMELKIPASARPAESLPQPHQQQSYGNGQLMADSSNSYVYQENEWTSSEESTSVQRIYGAYTPMYISYDSEYALLDGFAVGYMGAFKFLESNENLLLGFDVNANYHFLTKKSEGEENKISMASIDAAPIIAYRVQLSDNMRLLPFAGPVARYNFWGKGESDGYEFDLFKSDEGGWKPFLIGLKIGANLDISNFSIGIGGEYDFTHIYDNFNQSRFSISVGYTFP